MIAAPSGRELLHRVAMLLTADRSARDLFEQFAAVVSSVMGATRVDVALLDDAQSIDRSDTTIDGAQAIVPISAGGRIVGTLHVEWPQAVPIDEYQIGLLEACAVHLGARIAYENQRAERERLEQIASTDALTGLANRRTFDEVLMREWARCARSKSPLSVLLLDVDFFKVYNDTYGHIAGDQCLRQIALAIAGCVKRPGDVACRYGGEEFVVVLPETAHENAIQVGEAICEAVRSAKIVHQGSSLGYATVSIGCAGILPEDGGEPSLLTELADAQLYRAKENGRNRVASESGVTDAPLVERQTAPKHNLPGARTQFFGRDGDLGVMMELLNGCRLLTLAGSGGVGKTRLAVEFARRHANRYGDGVTFVDLAPLTGGAFVSPTVLAALGAREEAGRDTDETLVDVLRERRVLLVLDNCEHVVDAAAALADRLLEACPAVSILATSRHTLDVPGEQVYRLAAFHEGDAVALFSSRAQAASPGFSLSPENVEAVKRICAQLDGIPLAIELAAARVRAMGVDELERQLRDRFRLLTGGRRAGAAHQRALYDTIEWSYNLLDAQEKAAMRRLALFAGAFSLDTAAAMYSGDGEQFDVIDVLTRLIDKSLLHFDPIAGRYWLLESTKDFGIKQLESAGELETLRALYATRIYDVARDAEKRFTRGAGDGARVDATSFYADVRAAMEWALAEENDVRLGAALVASLTWFWTERGSWREGRFWLQLALKQDAAGIGLETVARLRLGSAVAYYVQGEFALMEAEARRCEEAYAVLDDATGVGSAQNLRAIGAQFAGRLAEAHDLWRSVLQISRDVGNARMEAVMLGNLAELLTDWKGDFSESERLYESAAQIHRDLTDSFPLGVTLGDWSATAAYQGDYRRAERLALEALETFRGIEEEMRTLEQLIRIGHYRVWARRIPEAKRALREALEPLRTSGNPLYIARAAEALAELAAEAGRHRDSARLLGFVDDWRARKALPRPDPLSARVDCVRATCAEQLGNDACSAAQSEGKGLSEDAVFALARTLLAPR